MPISNVSGSNFTTLYSSYQGNTSPYVPIPPSNANVSGQNYTTLYSAGSGTAPVPMATYGNANVESFLAVGSDTGGNVVGNILSTGLISATGNIITDQYFIGTLLGNITGNFVVPGLNTQVIYNNNGNAAASSGLTFVAASNTLTSGGVVSAVGNVRGGNLTTVGQVSATGNVTGNYFIGNGSQLTGLPATYGNANVSNFLASGNNTSNITTTANIAGTYILGNGSQLTGLPATYSNANVTTLLANFGSNVISTTGNITAGYFIGNGSALTSITAANITGTVANATYALNANASTYSTNAIQANVANVANSVAGANVSGTVANATYALNSNAATFAGTVTTAAQPNITSVGILTAINTSGAISATGNITGNVFTGNGAALTSLTGANVTGVVANATYALNANAATFAGTVTDAAQPNITSVGILTAINTSGAISATGNITGNVFIGNGAGLTNINAANIIGAYGNANVAANLAAFANNPISTSGNITAGYFIGNGSELSNITGANITGIVPLAQYVTQNAQANITSVGTLTGLSVSGNINAGNVVTSGTGLLVGNVFSEVAAGTTAAVLTARMATDDTFRIAVGGTLDSGFVELATADGGSEPIYVRQYQNAGFDPFGTLIRSLTLLDSQGDTSLPGNISVVGNINGANLNISNDALILGNLTVNGNTTFINSNVVTINDKFINLANNAANASAANGGGIGIGPIASEYATLTYDYLANVWTTNIGISATGNITGNYFIGNGSALTSLTGANVTGTVANATYALNANAATFAGTVTTNAQPNITSVGILTAVNTSGDISATGNITGNVFSGNAAGLTNIPGGNVTGTVPLAQYVTQNAQANITSVGTLTALSVSGNINTGNINTANYVAFGTTGAQTTAATGQMFWDATEQTLSLGMNNGVTQQIGLEQYILVKASSAITNGQAVMFTGAAGDNVQAAPADTTSVGFRPEYIIGIATQSLALNDFGYITTFGKVRGLNTNAYNVGDILWVDNTTPGGLTTTRPTDPNFQIEVAAVTKKSGGDGQIQVRVTPFNGLDSLTDVEITTPSTGQSLVYSGNVWVNANISAANITAAGSNTQIQFNDSGVLGANANLAYNKATNTFSTGIVSVTGNIGSSQQAIVIGSNAVANIGNLNNAGNIILSGKNIATDVAFAPDISNATTPTGGRVLIGAGIAGNTSIAAWDPNNLLRGPRVAIMDSWTKNNSAVVSGALTTWVAASLDGNITAGGSRVHGISSWVNVSGGAAGNTYLTSGGGAINNGLNALSGVLNLGGANGNLVTQIGANITTRYATATSGLLQVNGNGTVVGNGYGHISTIFTNATTLNISNVAAYGIGMLDLVATSSNIGNTIGYLFPDTTSSQFGLQNVGGSFQRGNVYAFMNAGNLAQVRLGSTREQHYYAFPISPATGNVTVDATKGKVQTLTLTGNVAVIDFTNFVTDAFNQGTSTNIPQQDDVTLIIQQPDTGPTYTVTLPTTLASTGFPVQYQNGVTAVNTDNLGRTYVNIRSQPNGMGGFPFYVVVESTAGSLPAAGSDASVQFNDGNVLAGFPNFSYNKTTATLAAGNILAYDGTANVWGNINAANYFTQPGGQVNAANIQATTQMETPQLYANAITDGGFAGTGNIQVNAGNVNITGNLNLNQAFYANTITAGAFVSTPALFTSDLTPPGGGPLNTTTTLSTINGNLSVTGTITGTGNITGGNLRTGGSVSATGNVISGNVNTGIVSATGNVIGGNLTTTGTSILASIRSYSQSQYTLGTSGTINIDKTNGQVQYLAPTANVTIGSLQNFVTTASTGNQADTVTLVIKQGATPYTVTMPTGNAVIKYAGGITSVGTTANSVTMISMTGANVAGAAMYMLTISPEFS